MRTVKENIEVAKCPVCGEYYIVGTEAQSRYIKLDICSECGFNEAFYGISDFIANLLNDSDIKEKMEGLK